MASRLYAILSDQQIPYQDPKLEQLMLRFLSHNAAQIEGVIYNGDVVDLPGVSHHDWSPDMDPNPMFSTSYAFRQTRDYLDRVQQAVGSGDDHWNDGNHEKRLEAYVIKHADHIYDLTEESGERTLDLGRLLGLAERGIARSPGGYPAAEHWLSPKISTMHGTFTGPSGSAARKALAKLGHSVIIGHTHKKSMIYTTRYTQKGPESLVACEGGTLARINLGYDPYMDGQQGFVTCRVFEDGTFKISDADYTLGKLRWQDQEFVLTGRGVKVSD